MTAGGSAARGLIDGRFELLERLGGGGMGLVWRARDLALEREVALKEVRPAGASVFEDDPVAAHVQRERVLREARALARLHHPNVVTIYHIVDSVEHQYPWLVMELVSGGSLDSRIERAPLSPAETARIGRGVLAALRAAHEAGIQHRDVKPANVLLRADGTPVLTDFGIAALREATALTTTGTVIGSPEYIAPERIRGQEGDPASDLWSLGMLMYVAVEGANPLRRETTLATIAAVLDAPLPEPQRAGPLTAPLAALLVRDPAARIDAARLDQLLAAVQREAGSGNGSGADPRYGQQFPPPSYPPPSYPPRSYPSGSFPPAGQSWSPHDAPPQHWQPQGSVQGQRRRRNRTFVASVTGVAVIGLSAALVWTLHDSSASASTGGGSHATGTPSTAGNAGANSQTASASPTDQGTGAGDQGTQVNLLTPAGARAAVRALKNQVGSREIIQLDVYPGYAIAQVLTAADPTEYDEYTYRDGQLDHSPGGTISDEKPFDPGAINWDALPTLLTEAKQRLKVANPTSEYLIIEGNFFGEGPGIGVYISNDYDKGGYMFTDFKGNIIRTVQ